MPGVIKHRDLLCGFPKLWMSSRLRYSSWFFFFSFGLYLFLGSCLLENQGGYYRSANFLGCEYQVPLDGERESPKSS
ncbi:rCG63611 [Rattus norvegicus]|uniref:RCG63611 n=1 Tax=Rattus norvegicus TaxID=10116 RepID=A6JMU1_RAT|nr:rCG63611 [Rattus norvegicus]